MIADISRSRLLNARQNRNRGEGGEGGERERQRESYRGCLLQTRNNFSRVHKLLSSWISSPPFMLVTQHRNTISTEHCEQRQMNFPSPVLFLLLRISPDDPRTYSKRNFTNFIPHESILRDETIRVDVCEAHASAECFDIQLLYIR